MRKKSIKSLKTELWELCKQIIRKKYGNTCFTCGKSGLEGSNWHTGHFIPSASGGILLRYHLDNLFCQCYHCNVNLGGNGAVFYRNLVAQKGQDYVDTLFKIKNQSAKADILFYENKIQEYKKILETL